MIIDELKHQILLEFGFLPTSDQSKALDIFIQFLTEHDSHAVMVLRGSAGTGKTRLAGSIVRMMSRSHYKVVLLAPTGRAAKVFSMNSGHPAYTIHRRIYREKVYTGIGGEFNLNRNMYQNTLFIIDEASMISQSSKSGGGAFGSGNLLDDLIRYVYQGTGDKMMLIGDSAQLPPVGEAESPALQSSVLQSYGLKVYQCDLQQVLRQSAHSGILYNATTIRQMINHHEDTQLPKIRFCGFADIRMIPGAELVESLATSYSEVGLDETMVITRSNKRANIYNQGIRNAVLDREDQLTAGDLVMIVKNNYYWLEQEKKNLHQEVNSSLSIGYSMNVGKSESSMSFIANGDRAEVLRVRHYIELYGFHFAKVLLRFPDYDDYELDTVVLLDSLATESPALTVEQSEKLFQQVMLDYDDIPLKKDRMDKIRCDQYFNALQIKFAYAVTCYKAQGGQWSHIYVDQGYMTDELLTPDYIHWLYTAFTRATDKLFLVNWPKQQMEEKK